jgi:hypothetical protein
MATLFGAHFSLLKSDLLPRILAITLGSNSQLIGDQKGGASHDARQLSDLSDLSGLGVAIAMPRRPSTFRQRDGRVPALDQVKPDTPLRLDVAAALAFPDGSMGASGLRKEAGRGRLVIERVAGKDYTTLAAIERMRELCRFHPKARDSGCVENGATNADASLIQPSTSSETVDIKRAQAAAGMIVQGLKESLRPISTGSTPRRRRKASVIPIRSQSPTF